MKRIAVLLLLLFSSISCFGLSKKNFQKLKDKEHKSMHEIVMVDRNASGEIVGGGLCTAYAIGPHTLLTAEHCNDPYTNAVYIDASKKAIHENKVASYSVSRQFDHEDHMLLNVAGAYFPDYVPLDAPTALPVQGERVYFWGNPGGVVDQYREVMVMGAVPFSKNDDPNIDVEGKIFYSLTGPVIGGDSGSSLFNSKGQRVAIVTYGIDEGQMIGAFPIKFTQIQIDKSLLPADPDHFLTRPVEPSGEGDLLPFLQPMQRRVGSSHGSSHGGEHQTPRGAPNRGQRGPYRGNPRTRDHFHGGRFDHDYYLSHFGLYHQFYAYDMLWYGNPYLAGSVFVFSDCGFEVMTDIPPFMLSGPTYVVETDGVYYLTSAHYPTLFVGLTIIL